MSSYFQFPKGIHSFPLAFDGMHTFFHRQKLPAVWAALPLPLSLSLAVTAQKGFPYCIRLPPKELPQNPVLFLGVYFIDLFFFVGIR